MSASTTVAASGQSVASPTTVGYGREFWEWLWRTSGIQSVGLFVIAYGVYGYQPLIAAALSLPQARTCTLPSTCSLFRASMALTMFSCPAG
jgi:hypothetical protein